MEVEPTWGDRFKGLPWEGNKAGAYDYASAEKWIQGGRGHNVSRTAYHSSRAALVRRSPTSIAVSVPTQLRDMTTWAYSHVMYVDIVTYHQDGLTVLNMNGMLGNTTDFGVIACFVPGMQVYQRKHRMILRRPIDGHSPEKMQKCRNCKGVGKLPGSCRGRTYCWEGNSCELPDGWGFSEGTYPHYHPCEHGLKQEHVMEWRNCYVCSGKGQANYGTKPLGMVWDGLPVGLRANYEYVDVRSN